jgi:DNA-binding PadR family transcriptional regulator
MPPRITPNGALVLQALAGDHRYGFEIMDFTGLASGTVYPILRRFEELGLVTSRWEERRTAHPERRPRRRYYELTGAGREGLRDAADLFATYKRVFGEV